MAEDLYDIAIIGAGCAGLSLATELAKHAAHLKIVLIDPRLGFDDDRTWCFWTCGDTPVEALIDMRWSRWRFSDAQGQTVVHQGEAAQYACVRAASFYRSALHQVKNAGFHLRLGETVHDVAFHADRLDVITGTGVLQTRNIVDTRPQPHAKATMFQVFAGIEVEADMDAFDIRQAGLMEDMGCDADGFHFTYILPFSSRRALIEFTRFSPIALDAASLEHHLETVLARRGLSQAVRLRKEVGVLPMGQTSELPHEDARWIRAGAGAGALRAATGYAFLRIQKWAQACALSISSGGPPLKHQPEPVFRAWLDTVFLSDLVARPFAAADHFLRIANGLRPDAFARFMSDMAGAGDIARLMTVLPAPPFLSAAIRVSLRRGA